MAVKKPTNRKPIPKKELTADKPTVVEKPLVDKPTIVMYVSKKIPLQHPFQNIRFMPGSPVECRLDSWLESQVNAGLIKVIEK